MLLFYNPPPQIMTWTKVTCFSKTIYHNKLHEYLVPLVLPPNIVVLTADIFYSKRFKNVEVG
jgi:hypothetical protein